MRAPRWGLLALLALAAPAASAESLYKCTDPQGAVSIQSTPCAKGSTQVWKRDATPEPPPSPEQLAAQAAEREAAARAAAAEQEARRAARAAAEARQRAAAQKPPGPPEPKSECRRAHEFAAAVRDKPWIELSDWQLRRIDDWVVEQCREDLES